MKSTQRSLAEIFYATSRGQTLLQQAREELIKHGKPATLFKLLDKLNFGSISARDFHKYLATNDIQCSLDSCQLIIHQYDDKRNGRLGFDQFLTLIVPKNGIIHQPDEDQPQFYFLDLLVKENQVQQQLQRRKSEIFNRENFNLLECYKMVGFSNSGITEGMILDFWKKFQLEADVKAFMKRVDKDKDMFVSYTEFCQWLLPRKRGSFTQKKTPVKEIKPILKNRGENLPVQQIQLCQRSPLKDKSYDLDDSFLQRDQQRPSESLAENPSIMDQKISVSTIYPNTAPVRFSDNHSYSSPVKYSNTDSFQYFPPLQIHDFLQYLHQTLTILNQLELYKQNLSNQIELNLAQAFSYFDKARCGISFQILHESLYQLGFPVPQNGCRLLITRYSPQNRLNYPQFSTILTPVQYSPNPPCKLQTYGQTLSLACHAQNTINELKEQFLRVSRNTHQYFYRLDIEKKGYLTLEDFERVMNRNCRLLMRRFSLHDPESIHYSDFIQELLIN